MRSALWRLTSLMGAAFFVTGCLRGQPLPASRAQAPFNSGDNFFRAAAEEPAFGNTATNVRRIQQTPDDGVIRFAVFGDNRNSSPFSSA